MTEKADDTNSSYYYHLAECHKELEDFGKTIEDSQTAIELDEKNLKAHLLLGQALGMVARNQRDVGKLDTALKRMTKGSF